MKKILSVLVLASFLALVIVPVASAESAPKECCTLKRDISLEGAACTKGSVAAPTTGAAGDCTGSHCSISGSDNWGMFCLMNTLYSVTDWIFVVLIAISGVMVIMGAFTLLTSAGNPEKTTAGRNYILYAVIGLVVGFFARAIPSLVRMVVGG